MQKIIVGAFVSLDGVMQAPGGPDEDPTGGFKYGGWVAPLWDEVTGKAMVTKYVATHRPESLTWQNSRALGTDVVATLRELKRQDGPALTQGSTELLHTLFANDLVDEVRVLTYPLVLGRGKRLFDSQSKPAAFSLVQSKVSRTKRRARLSSRPPKSRSPSPRARAP